MIFTPFSPFVVEYLIPSIYEIIDYGFDGIRADGECRALPVDFKDGVAKVTLDRLEIHSILEFSEI